MICDIQLTPIHMICDIQLTPVHMICDIQLTSGGSHNGLLYNLMLIWEFVLADKRGRMSYTIASVRAVCGV